MGLLDLLFGRQNTLPVVTSIMPDIAKEEIISGRLPILNNNNLFLQPNEQCHYIEKAVLLKDKTQKSYVRRKAGYSIPGFFKGTRIFMGGGRTNVQEQIITEQFRGILYITNRRVVFVAQKSGFDNKLDTLTAINTYTNAIELQFGQNTLNLILPDGNIATMTLRLIK
jgi:hypothetical protein